MIIGEITVTDNIQKSYFQQKDLIDLLSKKKINFIT